MACELAKDDHDGFPGTTLFTTLRSRCLKPTAVYIPPAHIMSNPMLNVVIWLHGLYVNDHKYLLFSDPSRVRQQVLSSGRDVVLVAPFLGHGYFDANGNPIGNYSGADLASANWGERFLTEVLAGLQQSQGLSSLDIKNVIIACHSGGGVGMRNLVGTLGKYQGRLAECWGLDCLYRGKPPDDATFWYDRMLGPNARPLYVFYGPSTIRQSVKLDLMGRGKATRAGNRADPPGPRINDLHVQIGHYENFAYGGQVTNVSGYIDSTVDDLMSRAPAQAKPPTTPPKAKDGDYVEQAAVNLKANYIFPSDVHYFIARAFFLSRLRSVKMR